MSKKLTRIVIQVCTCEIPKFSDTNIQTKRFYHGVIPPNDANRIANSDLLKTLIRFLLCSVCLKIRSIWYKTLNQVHAQLKVLARGSLF